MRKDIFEPIIDEILKYMQNLENHSLSEQLIEFIIFIVQKNDYEFIDDYEWLLIRVCA